MSNINDLLNSVVDKNPIEFGNAFDDLMRERTLNAIASRKIELAQSVYGTNEDTESDEVDDEEDIEADDESFDDIEVDDFDLDDIDLDDLDFEEEGIVDDES